MGFEILDGRFFFLSFWIARFDGEAGGSEPWKEGRINIELS